MTLEVIILVMADSSDVSQKLPYRDRPFFSRKIRDITLDLCIQIDLSLLHKLEDRHGCYRLCDRSETIGAFRLCGDQIFKVRISEPFYPYNPIFEETDRYTGDFIPHHVDVEEISVFLDGFGIRMNGLLLGGIHWPADHYQDKKKKEQTTASIHGSIAPR